MWKSQRKYFAHLSTYSVRHARKEERRYRFRIEWGF
jgi:hypothetical protein